jgi:phosphinothricin acetyltransferase
MLRQCKPQDASAICGIYNHYVRETVITFEETQVSEADMAQRIVDVSSNLPWYVWAEADRVIGYAYATPWKARAAYKHSVEAGIYLEHHATGRGIGTSLYKALIADLRRDNFHCVIGGAALPNPASVALHERLGFSKVAEFKEVGFKLGRWVDVAYWELVLDRVAQLCVAAGGDA